MKEIFSLSLWYYSKYLNLSSKLQKYIPSLNRQSFEHFDIVKNLWACASIKTLSHNFATESIVH